MRAVWKWSYWGNNIKVKTTAIFFSPNCVSKWAGKVAATLKMRQGLRGRLSPFQLPHQSRSVPLLSVSTEEIMPVLHWHPLHLTLSEPAQNMMS